MATAICELCGKEMQVGDWFLCPHEPTKPVPKFTPYEVQIGPGQTVTIDSIQTAMRIEREYGQRYEQAKARAAAGGAAPRLDEAPIWFRDFHQDHSNRDRHVLGEMEGPGQRQQRELQKRQKELRERIRRRG